MLAIGAAATAVPNYQSFSKAATARNSGLRIAAQQVECAFGSQMARTKRLHKCIKKAARAAHIAERQPIYCASCFG